MPTTFKPCPFCGGTDIRCTNHGKVSRDRMHYDDDVWSMCCYSCGATFPNRYRRELLLEAWNRRAPAPTNENPPQPARARAEQRRDNVKA